MKALETQLLEKSQVFKINNTAEELELALSGGGDLENLNQNSSLNETVRNQKENPRIKDSILKKKVDPIYQTNH